MFEGTAITVLLAAAGGAVAGNLLSFLAKSVDNLVRETDTKLDDKLWSIARGAMSEAMEEFEVEITQVEITPVDEARKAEDLASGH